MEYDNKVSHHFINNYRGNSTKSAIVNVNDVERKYNTATVTELDRDQDPFDTTV